MQKRAMLCSMQKSRPGPRQRDERDAESVAHGVHPEAAMKRVPSATISSSFLQLLQPLAPASLSLQTNFDASSACAAGEHNEDLAFDEVGAGASHF